MTAKPDLAQFQLSGLIGINGITSFYHQIVSSILLGLILLLVEKADLGMRQGRLGFADGISPHAFRQVEADRENRPLPAGRLAVCSTSNWMKAADSPALSTSVCISTTSRLRGADCSLPTGWVGQSIFRGFWVTGSGSGHGSSDRWPLMTTMLCCWERPRISKSCSSPDRSG